MAHIDVQPYVRRPRINTYSGIVLTTHLLKAAPKDPDEAELEALAEMRAAAEALQDTVRVHQAHAGPNLRMLDRHFDGAWASLQGHLSAATRMIGEADAEAASELLTILVSVQRTASWQAWLAELHQDRCRRERGGSSTFVLGGRAARRRATTVSALASTHER